MHIKQNYSDREFYFDVKLNHLDKWKKNKVYLNCHMTWKKKYENNISIENKLKQYEILRDAFEIQLPKYCLFSGYF